MEQFEKWFWNKYNPHDDSYDEDSVLKTGAGWEAALAWVYDLYWDKGNNPELFQEILEKELGLKPIEELGDEQES